MDAWRVRRHYGFGVARVSLRGEPHYAATGSLSVRDDLQRAGRDFLLASLPALLLAVLTSSMLVLTTSRDRSDYSDVEVVLIRREAPETLVPPAPIPEAPPVKPPEPPVRVAEVKPKPVVPPPPPPSPPKVQKPLPAPKPKVARAPKPKPVVRPQIDTLAKPRMATPRAAPRSARAPRDRPARPAVDLAAVAAPKLARSAQPAARTRQFASVRAPSRPAPASLGAAPIAAVAGSAPARAPARARTDRPSLPSRRAKSAPRLDFAAAAPATSAAPAAPAALRGAQRDSRAEAPGRSPRTASPGLVGVPLAALAVCVSDREEEALKRKLVAAVTTQTECVSRAGAYRFVETKNLNAFLMTIERSPTREEADRCVELRHALACVTH